MIDRVQTLETLSGLRVTHRFEIKKNKHVFMFYPIDEPNHQLKEIFTYKKARAFAQGVDIGRRLSKIGK